MNVTHPYHENGRNIEFHFHHRQSLIRIDALDLIIISLLLFASPVRLTCPTIFDTNVYSSIPKCVSLTVVVIYLVGTEFPTANRLYDTTKIITIKHNFPEWNLYPNFLLILSSFLRMKGTVLRSGVKK